jgi:hypothetical protein
VFLRAFSGKMLNATSTIMNTATGIMKAQADPGGIAGIALGVTIGIMGAVQLATILSQQPPKASQGMVLWGRSHGQGGIPVEAEHGEAIINARSTQMFLPQLSAINRAGGGVSFTNSSPSGRGMTSPSTSLTVINTIDPGLMDRYLASSSGQKAIVNIMRAKRYEVNRVLK